MVKLTRILVVAFAVIFSISSFVSPTTVFADTSPSSNSEGLLTKVKVRYVSPDGDDSNPGHIKQPFRTIQHGINVSTVEGDTLLLADGIYTGDGNRDITYRGKALAVKSESGNPEACIIDCQGTEAEPHRGFIFQDDETQFSSLIGITIRNGYANQGGAIKFGGNYLYENSESPTIVNCTFENNAAGWGGALDMESGRSPILTGCVFRHNTASNNGGAIAFRVHSWSIITDCVFDGNTATINGGAISNAWESYNQYINCVFKNNSAQHGGAYGVDNGDGKKKNSNKIANRSNDLMTDCQFIGNVAEKGGAVYSFYYTTQVFVGCGFFGNQATIEGGAICSVVSKLHCTSCYFLENVAPVGGAFSIVATGHPFDSPGCTILESTFYANQADIGSAVSFVDVEFWHNKLENLNIVGGIAGEAISCESTDSVTISCVNLFNNEGGDWVGHLTDMNGIDGNISADPLFCDAPAGEFTVMSNSPCLPENHPDGTSCGLIGAGDIGCTINPVITGVIDVGNDQGGQVRLVWDQCTYDSPGSLMPITGYGIYRRQDGYKQQPVSTHRLAGWDFLTTVPARGDVEYQYVAPTLCDSTINHGMCLTTFMVSAMTNSPTVFYDSQPDSGYSVDNLSPEEPSNLNVAVSNESNALSWEASASEDVSNYMVFRDPPFANSSTVITSGTNWEDSFENSNINGTDYNYWLAAVDHSGNLSDVIYPSGITGVSDNQVPVVFALHGNTPNPFNPSTSIAYDLPRSSPVGLRIYDIAGRLVRDLSPVGVVSAGSHKVQWHGTDETGRRVSSGVYLYRLETSGFVKTRQMVLVK